MSTKELSADLFGHQDLAFLSSIDLLKKVERQTLIMSGGRRENTAEHSWHLAVAVIAMQNCINEKDRKNFRLDRAIQMALVHDIVEIDAGDTFLYSDTSNKKALEDKAAERIFGLLKNEFGQSMFNLWHEFEARTCAESRFVGALDRFLPLYANYLNQGYAWKNHKITVDMVRKKALPSIQLGSEHLFKTAQKIVAECETRGYFF